MHVKVGLRHTTQGRFFPLRDKQVIVGSADGCQVILDEPGVAAQQACVRITNLGIEIDDLASGTPSLVNGYAIKKHFLSPNDEVRFGTVVLRFEMDANDEATPVCKRCGAELTGTQGPVCAACGQRAGRSISTASSGRLRTGSSRVVKPAEKRPSSRVDRTPHPPDHAIAASDTTRRIPKISFEMDWLQEFSPMAVLGEGSQGRVYKLRERATGKVFAAKRLWTTNTRALARFEREVEALSKLNHPAIVGLHTVRKSESLALLVMEFVDGPNLGAIINQQGRLPVARALTLAARVAEGLAAAAENGVIHRDVKPSNILIGAGDLPKLVDFGLVSLGDSRTKLTQEGQWIGTPQYMAPEQVDGGETDGRTDTWGLGATFYQAIVGTVPFEGKSPTDVFRAIVREPLKLGPLKEIAGPEVAKLFERMLSKSMEDRPTPAQVAEAVSTLTGSS